jgi:pyruvate/2-oxoglutarate dehydrogenase complex dihydrolipoamide dehydrogenase (E3) component
VIGGGAGGLAAASAAAAFGVNVVLIDNGKMGGAGCVLPSKALLVAADRAQIARNGVLRNRAKYLTGPARFGADFAAVRAHVQDAVAAVAPQDSRERFNALGVRIVDGEGHFTDPATVAVNGFDIKARRFVIATGSSPVLPPIPGLAETPYLTSETICDLAECPRHLIVIGAGATGLELAQAFRRLGAEVTVLEATVPLAGDDSECSAIVLDALGREGVVIRGGIEVLRVRRALARLHVDIAYGADQERREETIEGTHILVAAGRRPNLDGLDLETAGIRFDLNGITVDRRLRTSNKQVYAIGDVTGAPQFTHLANHHAGLVIRHALFRTPVRADRLSVPWVIYTDPELAQAGLIEEEARAQAGIIRVLRSSYRENDRAVTRRDRRSHQDHYRSPRRYSRCDHCRRRRGRKHRRLGARHPPKTEYRGHCRGYCAVSDLCRGGKTRCHDLFHAEFDVTFGASHHRVAAPFGLKFRPRDASKALL